MDVVWETPEEDLTIDDLPPDRVPTHIAVIMDGNGRWARQRGLPRLAGHRAGTENLREILRACVDFGVKILTIYAFSTENWGRPEEEVQGLRTGSSGSCTRRAFNCDTLATLIRSNPISSRRCSTRLS